MNSPPPEAHEEAKLKPNGWVYKVQGKYGPHDSVPPDAIVGAWRVDENGKLTGEFMPNPNYRPKTTDPSSPMN
jgi:hypothetical protein